ncbi:LysR family transcriptional regulator [Shewanella sp. NKUCC05_KAH]|uniref:LysR family transcriptional regulator n=1 Tax=unclassified Shewanella TaxID=196818 RepID=UPI00048D928C|nr:MULTISPECIES: LysR family transcriptional regulator [unclassified Shewanella]AVI68210.1 LysR family transcriptional regulator [Shewanella sp. WE21]MBW3525310.1 LysR family transcriptional regulator [Shewanella sp. NKUCC05_KAH]MCU8037899.1 LysR family transcriptional regulator [Shewanella sp. SM69]
MINPQWLHTFSVLVEKGNFTRTAEAIGITQAAVSQHISRLEETYGTLFLRRTRQLEITPIGENLLTYVKEVECAQKRLQQKLIHDDANAGDISLITPGSIGLTLFPLLIELQQAFPALSIRHRFAPDSEIVASVLANEHEIGMVTLKPSDPRIHSTHFTEEPLELVVPASHKQHEWTDLQRLGFISHPDGEAMATRLLSRKYPTHPGIQEIPCKGFTNQISLILEPVAKGLGFTVIPQYARKAFERQEDIYVVECGSQVVDTIWLIHRAEWPLSRRAQKAITFLKGKI